MAIETRTINPIDQIRPAKAKGGSLAKIFTDAILKEARHASLQNRHNVKAEKPDVNVVEPRKIA